MLVALTAALIPALAFAPTLAAGTDGAFADQRNFRTTVSQAFVEYWNSDQRNFTPDLERAVDYWFRFHVVKAVIAAILLIVLVALGVLLWKAFLRAGGAARRSALASGGILATMLALLSLVVVIANVQGAVAPFTSLLTLLPVSAPHGELAATLEQVRQQLADNQTSPALAMMISDNSRYHLAVAVMATIVAIILIGISVMLWKKFAKTESRRTRRVLGSYGSLAAFSSLIMIVLAVANATNSTNSAQALTGFFGTG